LARRSRRAAIFRSITSVIGILLVITLLLALHLDEVTPASTDDPTRPELQAQLSELLDRLAQLRAAIAQMQQPSGGADPEALAGEIALLKLQAAAVEERNARSRAALAAMLGDRAQAAVQSDLAKFRAELTRQQTVLDTLRQQARESQRRMAALEKKARDREAALLAERNRQNVLQLIPERSRTSKEPVLGVVTGSGMALQPLESAQKITVGRDSNLRAALQRWSPLNQYFVFYFKPSAARRFDEVLDTAREAGFEVGYDAIPENTELQFAR
jgi:hypothetical protein